MRGIQAKRIMGKARAERAGENGVIERGLVQRGSRDGTLVQSPFGIRALYLKLKARFLSLARYGGVSKAPAKHGRKPADTFKTVDGRAAAIIQKPLEFILGNCPPVQKRDAMGQEYVVLHPTYVVAKRAAARGDGGTVKRIAASFA